MEIKQYQYVNVTVSKEESEAVQIAVRNLKQDLRRVLDCRVIVPEQLAAIALNIHIKTLEKKEELEKLKALPEQSKVRELWDEAGNIRKEAFLIMEQSGELFIWGTDRRGTVFGIYDFCEWLGVSPWYFFADVPIKRKAYVTVPEHFLKVEYPGIEYRGIFINDEEELEHWVQRYMGEETIGVKTYEKIFELLLRLKLNYIWPAMHVNSFNLKRENGELANRMGMVVGTSHCDMLMRSNNREWKPWIQKKGYKDVEYDYSIPGRNREILKEYWQESVEQNKDFEVSYTLGMRGIHDSGFETKTLEGKRGKELLQAKIELLDSVIKAQEQILKDTLEHDTVKNFVPYKEVLELYDNGLEVPDDFTLIWVNDNYGYVRRYPGEKEKCRKGGNGLYYHNSYWAPPGASYLFIDTIPLAHTRNELLKAYNEGIKKIWVTNFGAIKPLEEQMSFYARFAWEVGKKDVLTEDVDAWTKHWINQTFSGNYGQELATLLNDFDQITNVRKIEQMDVDAFSQTAYGDEAATRLNRYFTIFNRANEIYDELPEMEKDAFFQLVLMKIHATFYTNAMYYYADRSNLCMRQGKSADAQRYTDLSRQYDAARQKMLEYYNHVMAGGKWDGILTPEDFPPPRTAMHPACMPPLFEEKEKMIVTVWNEEKTINFHKPAVKWIEIANAGTGSLTYQLMAPEWLTVSKNAGEIQNEERILITIDLEKWQLAGRPLSGEITVSGKLERTENIQIPICVSEYFDKNIPHIEDDGRIIIEADAYENEKLPEDFKEIKRLGRDHGILIEAKKTVAGQKGLLYHFYLLYNCTPQLEIHRFPTLNSVGQIRFGIRVNGGETCIVESESKDEHKGTWKENVRNNVDKVYLDLPELPEGMHSLELIPMDAYTSFSRLVLYTEKRKENSLGLELDLQQLPEVPDLEQLTEAFYGKIDLLPRPALYLPLVSATDTLVNEDIYIRQEQAGEKTVPENILKAAEQPVAEEHGAIRIEAASALAHTEYANASGNEWSYCNSPSHGDTGLAMYIRDASFYCGEPLKAPKLQYQIKTTGGVYQVWMLLHMWGNDTSHFTIGLDGKIIPEEQLYNGTKIWRYSMEQVWKWVPVWKQELTEGTHTFSIYDLSPHLRFDRIYFTKGEELPPLDKEW